MKILKGVEQDFLVGIPVEEIAKRNRTTRETVYKRLRQIRDYEEVKQSLKNVRETYRASIYKKRLPQIYKLKDKGMSTVKISKKLHIPYYALSELLRGTRYDNTTSSKSERNRGIWGLYRGGRTQQSLAKEFSLSQAQISDILHKFHNGKFRTGPKARS